MQLKALRPDLEYVPIRGNIQTRLSKLAELDGVVLAAAGLKRMGLADQVTEFFSTAHMLPASGQGILAIETLSPLRRCEGDRSKQSIDTLLARVNDTETFAVAAAEMAYLKALNAGCQFPVASFAEFVDTAATADGVRELKIRGIYWDENSQKLLRAEVLNSVSLESPDLIAQSRAVGVALAQKIREQM